MQQLRQILQQLEGHSNENRKNYLKPAVGHAVGGL